MEPLRTGRDALPPHPAGHRALGHPVALSAVFHAAVVAVLAVGVVSRGPTRPELAVAVEIVFETPAAPRKPMTGPLPPEGTGRSDVAAAAAEAPDDSGAEIRDRPRIDPAPHGVPADLGAPPRAEAGNAIKDPGSGSGAKQRAEETAPDPFREGRPPETSALKPPAPLASTEPARADEPETRPVAVGSAIDGGRPADRPAVRPGLSERPAAPGPPAAPRSQAMEADRHVVVARGNPSPEYPRKARRRGLEGRVILRVVVDPAGKPARVEVSEGSGHGLLDRAAVRAVRRWRFTPARRNGRAVGGEVLVPVVFRLTD